MRMGTGTVLGYLLVTGRIDAIVLALPLASATGQTFTFFMRPEGSSIPLPGTFPQESGLSFYIQRDGGVASGGLVGIRYVLVPNGVPAKMAVGFWNDYKAVTEYFGFDP